jgi:hypothetical protein
MATRKTASRRRGVSFGMGERKRWRLTGKIERELQEA